MALVMNASATAQEVQVFGKYFTFAPGQIKQMQESHVAFLTSRKAYLGFVDLPETLEDLEFKASKEGQKIIADAKARGVASRVQHLNQVRDNELISLKQDLEQANIKGDVRAWMSKGAVNAMKELATYRAKNQDTESNKIKEIEALEKLLEE